MPRKITRCTFRTILLVVWMCPLMAMAEAPREYETTLFLSHESGDVWHYYSLTRFGAAESPLSNAELASVVNRSVAVYR